MYSLSLPGFVTPPNPERELCELISALFHDLREPLRTIQISIDLLQTPGDRNEDPALLMSLASQNTKRVVKMIDDFEILAWTGATAPSAEVDMGEVLESAKAALEASIRTSDATITSASLPHVRGDGASLSRVFQNLLSNAMKYRREEPPVIQIGCHESESDWMFSVRDNGIGIDAADTSGIFAAFRRLHPETSFSGNGLGLAICRRIVERHGGRIWLDSIPGQGSTFCFTLPRSEQQRLELAGEDKTEDGPENYAGAAQNRKGQASGAFPGESYVEAAA